jgi:signal transduction histidine kinase
MDSLYGPHLHAFGMKALVRVADDAMGTEALDEMLGSLGVRREQLDDAEAWFSLDFVEAFIGELMKRTGDISLLDRVASESISRKSLGFVHTIFKAFGTPGFAYEQIVRSTPRFNKIGEFTFAKVAPQKIKLRYRAVAGAPKETTPHLCRLRMMQLASIPTLFNLQPAKVEQTACMMSGSDSCDYALEWQEEDAKASRIVGLVVGAAIAALVVVSSPVSLVTTVLLVAAMVIGGWALGRNRELRAEVESRSRDLLDQHAALSRSMKANEQRFEELLQAKAEVDLKVEQRTSELSAATDRLSQTLQEIQALDRAKTDFFNNVSHELRSPLTLILAPLEDLTAGRAPPGGEKAAFEAMRRNAARLLHLINQLLDLAKIDAGQMEIDPVPTDLTRLVSSTLKGFEAAARGKGVELVLKVPSALPAVVLDVSWIESAVTNLVANALRFTSSGGSVRVTVEDLGGDVSVTVSDDGPGIAAQNQDKVFERFAQGDSSKRVVGGTGIGLALVREAARLHGGDVRLVSELEKGSTFTLTLPRRLDTLPGVRDSQRVAVPRSTARLALDELGDHGNTERAGPAPYAPLALVVEDNPELREFVADVLAVRYRVRTARDGAEAIALALELKPDVVVSDVAMPEMDGYQLCRALRANPETRTIPLLLVTARTEVASVLEGFEAGANDYVLKPFHGRELLARVDVHVQLRRMVQEFAQRERHATLGVLAASVAHQVRNPLTTLVSGLPAMRSRLSKTVDERTRDLIDVMIDCAGRIERMTLDLMDLSRIDREAGGEYRPSDGLRAAVRMLHARLPSGGVEVEDQVQDSGTTHGRPGDMNHVFLNLLDNAARAVESSGRIRVEAWNEGGTYCVRVGDSGPGIDEATAQRIFEPFFTTRQAGEGTGLGLAIARQVVQQAGGQIDVDRSDLGGAAFTVRIPMTSRSSLPAAQPVSN